MKQYSVNTQPSAETEIERAYLYIHERAPERAERWYNDLYGAIDSLENMPARCPVAPENDAFEREIRHLLLSPYRVLFCIEEDRVEVLHLRHMRKQPLGGGESQG